MFRNKETTDYSDKAVVERYKAGPVTRELVDIPESLRLLGDIRGKKILDLGCGYGEFTNLLVQSGADCVGIDLSDTFINEAKNKYPNIPFFQMSGADMKKFSDNYFDIIIMRMVLVNIDEEEIVSSILKESSRILKPDGTLIFSIHHPLLIRNFRDSIREVVLPEDGGYTKHSMHYKLRILFTDGEIFEFDCCHWPIDFLVKKINAFGFRIIDLTTPGIAPEFLPHKFNTDLTFTPHHMFFKSVKLSDARDYHDDLETKESKIQNVKGLKS